MKPFRALSFFSRTIFRGGNRPFCVFDTSILIFVLHIPSARPSIVRRKNEANIEVQIVMQMENDRVETTDAPVLLAMLIAARRTGNRLLEIVARRELAEQHNIKIRFARNPESFGGIHER